MRGDDGWPKREVLRLEGFSDAVFAFALTLLVVSLETPRTFDDLLATLKGAPAFAVCFALFWIIWKEHHRFFQRYGLDDTRIIVLNAHGKTVVVFIDNYALPADQFPTFLTQTRSSRPFDFPAS